jgi:hypothetical protein
LAAVIGPIVCELEGPIPILKTSKTERNIEFFLRNGFRHIISKAGTYRHKRAAPAFAAATWAYRKRKQHGFQRKTAPFQNPSIRRDAYGLPKMYVNARKAAKPASARNVTPQQDF